MFIVDVKTGVNGRRQHLGRQGRPGAGGRPRDARRQLRRHAARKSHIDKANEDFANGRSRPGIDELRLAEVDASFSRVLMPLQTTGRQIAAANRLMKDKRYYEANLALKAAEDGLQIDTVALSETAKPPAKAPARSPG